MESVDFARERVFVATLARQLDARRSLDSAELARQRALVVWLAEHRVTIGRDPA